MLKAIILGKNGTNNQCFEIFLDDKMVTVCYGKITFGEVENTKLPYKFTLDAETKDGHSSFGYVDEIQDMRS
jgi:hypothetical protein